MLRGLNIQLILEKYHSTAVIRNPPEMNGWCRHIFDQEETRRLTDTEIAEKELQQSDKLSITKKSFIMKELSITVIDFTIFIISPQRFDSMFMSFSHSEAMIRSFIINPIRIQQKEESVRWWRREELEIVILETWNED